jgi:hypothetical protein
MKQLLDEAIKKGLAQPELERVRRENNLSPVGLVRLRALGVPVPQLCRFDAVGSPKLSPKMNRAESLMILDLVKS